MSTYSPERIADIKAEMDRDGASIATKAAELGISVGTLSGALYRLRKRKKKPGRKAKAVEVIDVKKPKARLTLLDRLAIIETQLAAVRETLRSIQ